MKVRGQFLIFLGSKAQINPDEFYTKDKFSKLLDKYPKKDYEALGKKLFDYFMSKNPDYFEQIKDAFVDFHKIFHYYLREERIGIINALEFRPGLMRFSENLNIPCGITFGVLKALMRHFKVRSLTFKHTKCRLDGEETCDYQVNWMVKNVD